MLDLDLVDRIEIVRGPGSSVYGGNALFGVVNIVTRTAAQIDGVELGVRYSSFNTREGRASLGKRFDNGAELVASVSGMDSAGQDLFFPEFDAPETHFGRTAGTDYDRNGRFFARLSQQGLSLTAAATRREKGRRPAAMEPSSEIQPTPLSTRRLSSTLAIRTICPPKPSFPAACSGPTTHTTVPACTPVRRANLRAQSRPRARQLVGRRSETGGERHAAPQAGDGIEYQRNYRQEQVTYDDNPYTLYLDDRRQSQRAGVFVQDDFQWTESLKLSLGARYDKVTGQDAQFSPRLGLIYRSSQKTVWKLLYGSAFRAPNVYESFYIFPRFSDRQSRAAARKRSRPGWAESSTTWPSRRGCWRPLTCIASTT